MSTTAAGDGSSYLFVYGTLMTRAGGPLGASQRARLALAGVSLGAATIAGRLIDLGLYPGLLEPDSPADIVHGELLKLNRPHEVFAWLDAYESVSAVPSSHDEYVRIQAQVRLANGDDVTAWVYRYRGATPKSAAVAGGRWLG